MTWMTILGKQILGEVLMDELKAIREYVEDVPKIKSQLHKTNATVNEMSDRLSVLDTVVRDHGQAINARQPDPTALCISS